MTITTAITLGFVFLFLFYLVVSRHTQKSVEKEFVDKDKALKELSASLKDREAKVREEEKTLRNIKNDISKREYDLSIALLQALNGNNSFRRKNAYTSSLRLYEQKLLEREKSIDALVLQKIARGSSRSLSSLSQYPIFNDFKSYDVTSNPRLHNALTEKMTVKAILFPSCKIIGASGTEYDVSLESCTCPDFQHRHTPCKHMYRLAIHFGLLLQIDADWQHKAIATIERKQAQSQEVLKQERDNIRLEIKKNKRLLSAIEAESEALVKRRQESATLDKTIQRIVEEKSITHPWAAKQFADFLYTLDMSEAQRLRTKRNPALKASEQVAAYAKELRKWRRIAKEFEYKLSVYETAVPWLTDFSDLSPAELVEMASDTAQESDVTEYENMRNWLSLQEYNELSNAEKYQLALDRWKHRNKTNWEAGRDFERFVGYQFEKKGYAVRYTGALMGVGDLGRDLIAIKGSRVIVIQCKRWKDTRTVHEKHVFQLYGSVVACALEHPLDTVQGLLATTCPVSETAQRYADYLHMDIDSTYKSNEVFDYPMIKCNIGNTGEQIYHLPFDQQYDRVIITPDKGEFYAMTIKEAEAKGFRRAYRWRPVEN